jgi:hypothetical protein
MSIFVDSQLERLPLESPDPGGGRKHFSLKNTPPYTLAFAFVLFVPA